MTNQERAAKLAAYGAGYETLLEAIKQFPRAMWNFRPAPDRWTIQEVLVHITDSEANSYIRARRFIAEPGQNLMSYDESAWAKSLNYAGQSAEAALELFRWLRGNTYALVKNLPEEVWAHTAYHPENGQMSLDDWLDIYARHVPEHLEQMVQVYADWQASQPASLKPKGARKPN